MPQAPPAAPGPSALEASAPVPCRAAGLRRPAGASQLGPASLAVWLSNVFLKTLLSPNCLLFWLMANEFVFGSAHQLGVGGSRLRRRGAPGMPAQAWVAPQPAPLGAVAGGFCTCSHGGWSPRGYEVASWGPSRPLSPEGLGPPAAFWGLLTSRSVSGSGVEDGTSFLLTASPDWWLGEWGPWVQLPSPTPAQVLGPQPFPWSWGGCAGPGWLCAARLPEPPGSPPARLVLSGGRQEGQR